MGGRAREAWASVVATVLLLGVLTGPAGAGVPRPVTGGRVLDGRADDWTGASTLLGGTSQVSHGELVYQDYIYDDYGASGGRNAVQRGQFAGLTTGKVRYPTDEERYANNAADLRQLRIAADGSDVWAIVQLNTLRRPDTTVTAIAIDTNGDLTDTSGSWPRGAGVATPGADRVITIWADADGTGHAEVADLHTGATSSFGSVAVSTADADNAYELRLPRAAIGGTDWTLWAGTGLWDGQGWMETPAGNPTATTAGNGNPTGTARLFNVAFRDGETGDYFEDRQAASLAAGDITPYRVQFSPDAGDRPFDLVGGRTYEAVVEESFSIPPMNEGSSYVGVSGRAAGGIEAYSQRFDFFGRWQPYGLYLPSAWDASRTWPTMFGMHGRGGVHGSYFGYGGGFQRDIGEGHADDPMVIVTPLGRGRSHYESWGEGDVMQVLDDATRRFSVDPDRIVLGGYSMGGLGVYRLATVHPDRWATLVTWAGATSEFTGVWATSYRHQTGDPGGLADALGIKSGSGEGVGKGNHEPYGDYVQLVGNLRNHTILLQTGTNDEMLPLTGQIAPHVGLDDRGYRYEVDLFAGYDHLSWGLLDQWSSARDWIGTRSRPASPRHVDYTWSDSIADPATAPQLGLRYGSAWWVQDLTRRDADLADPEDPYHYGSVAATSRAIADDAHTVARTTDAQTSPHPYIRSVLTWTPAGPEPVANALDLALTNVASGVIDVEAAQLSPAGLEVVLTTDGPSTLLLRGEFDAPPTVGGPAAVTIDADGAHVEALEAGDIHLVFGDAALAAVPEAPVPLVLVVPLLAAAVLVVGRRRRC
jgi:S-formylglutathione hydrolase FrmB